MPLWFSKHLEEAKKADEAKLKLLQEIKDEQKEQAADRLKLLTHLNENIAKLVDKL